jgi:MoxR-like ATPase
MGSSRRFLANIRDVLNYVDPDSFVDFISDEMVISRYGSDIANNPQIRNFTKSQIRLIKDKVSKFKDYRQNKGRYERLFDLFSYPEKWDRERSIMLDEYFLSEKGQQSINSYFDKNKEAILADKLKLIEQETEEHKKKLNADLKTLNTSLANITTAIRNKKEELQRYQNEDIDVDVKSIEQIRQFTDEKLEKKREELAKLEERYNQLKNEYQEYEDLDMIEKRVNELDGAKSYLERSIRELDEQKEKISAEIHDKNNVLLEKLVSLKPQVDMLSGVLPTDKRIPIDFTNKKNQTITTFNVDTQQDVLNNINDQLNGLGRKLDDYEELANVVISIAQSQFTLFSGLPGTGKTSLAKLLGQAMGLNQRLLSIPVARGWTSQRDVIGFYNTLSQSYVPSATGMHDLLSQIQMPNDGHNHSTAIILLDEFNLSQPEHYFSPFMEMADPESSRILYTGDPKMPQLIVPEYVRFLGTINNDESVQTLTPRMIDRSAVIHFDDIITSSSVNISQSKEDLESSPQVLSGFDFIKLFNSNSVQLPSDVASILDDIVSALNEDKPEYGNPIVVSYRKIKAINNYYSVASPIMISGKLTALDYAVSQHVIPLIHGYGHGFGKRLTDLLTKVPTEMVRTRKRIERIISLGEQNLHTYGAFL